MRFTEINLKGAFFIEPEKLEDERGFFARTFCEEEFKTRGLNSRLIQCNISYSREKGTLRGMHYQVAPYEEAKLIRCTVGAIYDVIIDLRPDSPSFKKWVGIELTAKNHGLVYIPKGFAHGFQTLADDTEVFYQMSEIYAPEYAHGIRWNDPIFAVAWPLQNPIISQRDSSFPYFA